MKIAVIIPTRERIDRLNKVVQSILHTTQVHGTVKIYVGLDQNDPQYNRYLKYCSEYKLLPSVFEPRANVPVIMQSIGEYALEDGADLLIIASDDVVFQTPSWDMFVRDYYRDVPDKLLVGYFNNGADREMCEHFVVSKEWVKALGYFVPTFFNHFYVDTWISDIAERNGRLKWFRDVTLKHEHFKYGMAVYDAVYERTRKNNFATKDKTLFELNQAQRITDSNKIRDAICASAS